jgi:MFS family permease
MFLIGISLFTLFSALCGLAPSIDMLIGARVLQGLAGAMMMPQVLAITQVMFPPHERGFAFSLFGLSAGLASVAGPLAGGLLIGADLFGLDWRPIFLVNIPIGLIAVIAARALVPALPPHPGLTVDFGGAAIAGLSILLLVFPLIEGHSYGWPAWAFAMMAAAVVGAGVCYFYEKRRDAAGASELLPVSLMTNGNFVVGTVMATTFFSGVAGFFLVLAVFLQTGFGLSPLQSGLTTVPFPVGVLVASLVSGRLGSRWPRERIATGAVLLIVGMVALRFVVGGVGDTVDHWSFALPLFLSGLGMGAAIAPLFQTVLSTVPPRDAGSGSGALQSFQQIGSALGIAVTGQIFFSSLKDSLSSGTAAHPAFVGSMSAALIYELAAFGLVVVLLFFFRPPAQRQESGHGSPRSQAISAET